MQTKEEKSSEDLKQENEHLRRPIQASLPKKIEELGKWLNKLLKLLGVEDATSLKKAWKWEILNIDGEYTLADVIEWFRENYPGEEYYGCLIKEKDAENIIVLHHVYILKENNLPILDGSLPCRSVKLKKLSDDLQRVFSDKSMIIFK